ncbi:MAG: TonB family protein [Spirochaetaceae bacterium]|nr:TonB family protein [Myxococcales bacterium]MCB9724621.1 TonB family protein [Spirochaetaceae bacterium]HPG26029.1 TonB family protein [Myxococcota bacterium]
MQVARVLIAFVLACGVTFGLFYLMQTMIGVEGKLEEKDQIKVVDFVRVKQVEEVQAKDREPPRKEKIDDTPPPPDFSMDQTTSLDGGGIGIGAAVETDMALETGGGFSMASADGDAVPLVRVPPTYPERALQRGIEGRVLVEFTISKTGSVKDPKVVAYEPSTIFNKAALKAISQWKYNPKIVNGEPVEQPGQKIAIPFRLGSEAG